MWSDWLVFCVCGFQSVCPLTVKDRRLVQASWWERLTEGETGSCFLGGAVFSLLLFTWANYGGGNEENGKLIQKVTCRHCYTQCPQPCSRPPPTRVSTGDSWTLTGKSGSVSCGATAPFSWVLVNTGFCFCPPRVYFPVLCKFWQLYGGVNVNLLQENLCHAGQKVCKICRDNWFI